MIPSNIAERVDPGLGIRETARFVGPAGDGMLTFRHEPLQGEAEVGVVVCPSIFVDRIRTYRAEVTAARALASRGIVVQRFEYRGLGHSDGAATEVTFGRMCKDARRATELLRESGVERIVPLGTRIGGLVAARLTSEAEGTPLILWDPVVSGKRYFKEAFRALAMKQVAEGERGESPLKVLEGEADGGEVVDLFGFPVHRALYRSFAEVQVTEELGDEARPILWLYFGEAGRRGVTWDVVQELEGKGFDVTYESAVERKESWWFIGDTSSPLPEAPLVDRTTAWLETQLAARAVR